MASTASRIALGTWKLYQCPRIIELSTIQSWSFSFPCLEGKKRESYVKGQSVPGQLVPALKEKQGVVQEPAATPGRILQVRASDGAVQEQFANMHDLP